MLHPEFFDIVERTLLEGPTSVLTNGMLIDEAAARRLRSSFDGARYSLELRVSLDGLTAEENDPVRGRGTFAAITRGIRNLAAVGLWPVITVVEHSDGLRAAEGRQGFLTFARSLGIHKVRVKFLPLLRIGREPRRSHGYGDEVSLPETLDADTARTLQCNSSRLATQDHVMTCPILLDAPEARLGTRLVDGQRPIRLRFAACHTCIAEGLSCRT
jgi:molybdenum cofactor biosynthesis enzyme MoaA